VRKGMLKSNGLLFSLRFQRSSPPRVVIFGIPHLKSPTRNPMPQLR
jgi:hypothetical protein